MQEYYSSVMVYYLRYALPTKKHNHHGGAGRQSLAAWLLFFFAAPPRLPLRKGLTEGGVAGF